MQRIKNYAAANAMRLAIVTLMVMAVSFGMIDPVSAALGGFVLSTESPDLKTLDAAMKNALGAISGNVKELRDRMLDVEQKMTRKPGGGFGSGSAKVGELTALLMESDGFKSYIAGGSSKVKIQVPQYLVKAAITSAGGLNDPLVPADRRAGIVSPAQRRFTIRDLFQSVPTDSNMIEFARELVFTNSAGPQYDASSPTPHAEGAPKNESGITYELANVPVVTIAHFVRASRQVLSDSAALAGTVEGRLAYGLGIEEEDELLTGDGTVGTLNGLLNQATAFTGGATNQTALDTIAKAIAQLQVSEHQATGIILNPVSWLALQLLKDNEGRYLLGDPANMTEPRLWGIPVVATNSMTAGTFIVLDAPQAGYIADRETVEVRVSDSDGDNFTKNMITILCEERLALVIVRGAAIVSGSLSFAG